MVSLHDIKEANAQYLTEGQRHDMQIQDDFYRSQERMHVQGHCVRLGVGFKGDDFPLSTAVLEFVIGQLAVIYQSPATRWWRDAGGRLADTTPAAEYITSVYDEAQVETFMREAERLTRLHRNTLIRVYPSDTRRRVLLRAFTPLSIYRMPNPVDPSNLAEDRAIALEYADESFELWERTGEGWRMTTVSKEGEPLNQRPFGESAASPYPVLPMVMMYDGLPSSAYIPPRSGRTGRLLKLSAAENHLMSAMVSNVNGERLFFQDPTFEDEADASDMPKTSGPNLGHLLPKGVTRADVVTSNPLLDQFLRVLERLEGGWLRSEGLPPDSFRQSQTVTAIGLRTLAKPLQEKQESLRQVAVETEMQLWKAIRAVHNVHASAWEVDSLPDDVELELELGAIDHPTDPRENVETLNLMLLGGGISQIGYLMKLHNVRRPQALAMHAQIEADRQTYPPRPVPQAGAVDPAPASLNPNASTAHAALAAETETPE